MNQPQSKNRSIQFILILFLIIQSPITQSQRIFTATGIVVSTLDDNVYKSKYKGAVIRSSINLGFETKQWKRLSLSAILSTFTSGGKEPSSTYGDLTKYDYMSFDNYALGATGNFYMVNKKTEFYFGIGPRVDYVRSRQAIYTEWDGNGYVPRFLRKYLFGVTGSLGVNFQLDNFNLGIKTNYYYRHRLYAMGNQDYYTEKSLHRVRDNIFDLQLVFGYTVGKKKAD